MLKPRKKITRREIKEDPLVTQYVKYQKMLKTYSRQVNIGLIAIVAIVVITVLVSRSQKDAEARAEGAIVVAEQIYFSRDYARAAVELRQIAEDYPGTQAGRRALFFRANSLYETADYEYAYAAYKKVADDNGKIEMFLISSLAGMAACQENQMRYEDAATLYLKAAKTNKESFSAVYHLNSAARCYLLAEQGEKAKPIYKMILKDYPEHPIVDEVHFWMATI